MITLEFQELCIKSLSDDYICVHILYTCFICIIDRDIDIYIYIDTFGVLHQPALWMLQLIIQLKTLSVTYTTFSGAACYERLGCELAGFDFFFGGVDRMNFLLILRQQRQGSPSV